MQRMPDRLREMGTIVGKKLDRQPDLCVHVSVGACLHANAQKMGALSMSRNLAAGPVCAKL